MIFRKKIVRAQVIFWLTVLITGFAALAVSREIMRNRELTREINALEEEATRVSARNRDMLGLLEKLSAASFLEREAREKISFQKAGESVVIVNGIQPQREEDRQSAFLESETNPQRWWRYFFGIKKN